MMQNYPIREYPDPEELDPKKKAKAPPKKKKKAPPFPLPDWADGDEGLIAVQQKFKELLDLPSKKDNLSLDGEFLDQVKE